MAAAAGPKRTRQTYTRYQTLELEKVMIIMMRVIMMRLHPVRIITIMTTTQRVKYV